MSFRRNPDKIRNNIILTDRLQTKNCTNLFIIQRIQIFLFNCNAFQCAILQLVQFLPEFFNLFRLVHITSTYTTWRLVKIGSCADQATDQTTVKDFLQDEPNKESRVRGATLKRKRCLVLTLSFWVMGTSWSRAFRVNKRILRKHESINPWPGQLSPVWSLRRWWWWSFHLFDYSDVLNAPFTFNPRGLLSLPFFDFVNYLRLVTCSKSV